jgi:ankyrin repeat protein
MFKFISNDDSEKLDAALAKGGKLNEQNKKGESLVMACVDSGAYDCMKLLMAKGADLDLKDKLGDSVMVRAVKNGEAQSVELLLNHKARCIQTADASGMTALHWAVKLGDATILDLILDRHEGKELLTKADKSGMAPVHVSVASSCSEEVLNRLLLAGKQQMELVEKKHGRTPLLVSVARELLCFASMFLIIMCFV